MKTLYVVMGADGTRKSSTIRALTGIRASSMTTVATLQGVMDVYVQLCSPQEKGLMPDHVLRQVISKNASCVLAALWLNANAHNGTPNGDKYIDHFIKHGWTLNGIAILGSNDSIGFTNSISQPLHISNSEQMPANAIAALIRDQWQWK